MALFLNEITAQFTAMREELNRAEKRLSLLYVNDTPARAFANQHEIQVSLDPLITQMATLAAAYSDLGAAGLRTDAAHLDLAESAFREHLDDAREDAWAKTFRDAEHYHLEAAE